MTGQIRLLQAQLSHNVESTLLDTTDYPEVRVLVGLQSEKGYSLLMLGRQRLTLKAPEELDMRESNLAGHSSKLLDRKPTPRQPPQQSAFQDPIRSVNLVPVQNRFLRGPRLSFYALVDNYFLSFCFEATE